VIDSPVNTFERAASTWSIAPRDPVSEALLQRELGISRLLAHLLVERGLRDAASAEAFLKPSPLALHPPGSLAQIDPAVTRIIQAIHQRQRITLYSDYDADGITGTAILFHFFRLVGIEASTYIPERASEGYGLNLGAIDRISAAGCDLLITVDCGIRGHEPIDYARARGLDLIVTDHHEPGETLPQALAVINPKQSGCNYPFKELCGAGVSFKVAWEVARRLTGEAAVRVAPQFRQFLKDAMGLAAIGTIADIVPLRDENRILAACGLRCLSDTPFSGLRALLGATHLVGAPIAAEHVAFRLGPRLNAAGRMGSARRALELLTTADAVRGEQLAGELDHANRERQRVERVIFKQACNQFDARDLSNLRVLVAASDEWHPGVVGIVASRLVERYGRPAVLIALHGDRGRGSCRSVPGYELLPALLACAAELERVGGHAMAAGLEIRSDRIAAFRTVLEREVAATLADELLQPRLEIDALASFQELDEHFVEQLGWLEPTGAGNRPALLATRAVEVASRPQQLGAEGKHLAFFARHGSHTLRVMGFNWGGRASTIATGDRLDIAYRPKFNHYGGQASIELQLADLQPARSSA
jgi:single-stranded-DNA-specific exonuclease